MDKGEINLVHGLWNRSWSLAFLAHRMRKTGFRVRMFDYPTTSADLSAHASELLRFVNASAAATVHLMGHSLGGLVILKMLAERPELPPGRVMLLGTPLQGSLTVHNMLKLPGSNLLFGRVASDLRHGHSHVAPGWEIGMIAGSRPFGLGRLAGRPGPASDGTVALSETMAPGLAARLVLPVSHTGMLFSARVAREAGHFLESGQFTPGFGSA